MKLTIRRPTPLTDAFLQDLLKRMQACNPPVRKKELGDMINTPKQMINSWLKSKAKRPCSESLLKLQALIKSNFMRMWL